MSTIDFDSEEEKYLTNRDLDKIEGKGTTQSVGCFRDETKPWGLSDWARFKEALRHRYSRYFAAIFTNQHYSPSGE